ncbi:MAG: diaminobutyrate acetyltransferase [bacterium]
MKFSKPQRQDGPAMFNLVKRCPPLDVNSRYCNLLQATHFKETSIVAHEDGHLVGFVSGYRLPQHPDVLFIWQVAVDRSQRGKGLAKQLLLRLVARTPQITSLETTVTPDNKASQALFNAVAEKLSARMTTTTLFEKHADFEGQHNDEVLFHIGPFNTTAAADVSPIPVEEITA